MAKQATTAPVLDPAVIDAGLWEIAVIDAQLDAVKGTHAARVAKAEAAVDSVLDMWDPTPVTLEGNALEVLSTLDSVREDITQVRAELVKVWLTQNKAEGSETIEALKAARTDLVAKVEAFAKVMTDLGLIDSAPEIPKRSGGGRPAGSSNAVKVEGAQFYVIIGGTRKNMAASQNTLSSVAFYHSKALVGEKTGTAEFRKLITDKLGHEPGTTAWSVELDNGTVGMDLTGD